MQRQGGPDVRIKCFDVPPLDESADLRAREPIVAVLDPAPSGNWSDVFAEMLDQADPMLQRSHLTVVGGAITLNPLPYEARGVCILLRDFVRQVNDRYRSQGFGDEHRAETRRKAHEELRKLARELNADTAE